MLTRRARPARADVDEAALELLARHGPQILATARRYAATPEDAEDAYQRGLEILLTKAPTTSESDLVPWLKTVVLRTFRPSRPARGCAVSARR
jgi:DNA-directed RNA polymerase specialized sigma24 family protein